MKAAERPAAEVISPVKVSRLTIRLRLAIISVWMAGALSALSQTRQIVVLYDERIDLPGLTALNAGFTRALTSGSPDRIEIYREEMDLSRFDSQGHRDFLRNELRAKYAAKKIDVVVAVMVPALDFLLSHRDEVFPGTPIVFAGLDRKQVSERSLPADATGVLAKREFAPTLDLVAHLHPETERIEVVAGTSEFDARLLAQAREEFAPSEKRFAFTYGSNLPLPALLSRLSQLPPKTVILYTTMFRDGAGQSYVPHEVAERISAAANAPVYGFVDQYVGRGLVGGRVYGFGRHGEEAAGLVLKILAGQKPEQLSPIEPANTVTMFDARQLQRWKINEHRLPPGSTVLFREPTLWDRYRRWIIGGISICVLQALLIAALLTNRFRRRRAERSLAESEQRIALAVEGAHLGVWELNLSTNKLWVSDQWRSLFQIKTDVPVTPEDVCELIHPDDRDRRTTAVEKAIAENSGYEIEYRALLSDKTVRWIAGRARYLPRENGLPSRLLGVSADITDRKEAEELRDEIAHVGRVSMMGQLASALAHEINQPLGAILRNAEAAELFLQSKTPDLEEIRAILADIRSDDQRAGGVIDRMRGLLKRHVLDTQLLDLTELVGNVTELARPDAATRHVKLAVNLPAGLPAVRGDRVHLQQVLLNLILNGMDALNGASQENRRVTVSARVDSARTVEIAVGDTGHGIAAEKLAQIFDPFFTTKPDGMGMGLAISRTIIGAHGGRLWAENNSDTGATFRFTLPMADGARDEGRGARDEGRGARDEGRGARMV